MQTSFGRLKYCILNAWFLWDKNGTWYEFLCYRNTLVTRYQSTLITEQPLLSKGIRTVMHEQCDLSEITKFAYLEGACRMVLENRTVPQREREGLRRYFGFSSTPRSARDKARSACPPNFPPESLVLGDGGDGDDVGRCALRVFGLPTNELCLAFVSFLLVRFLVFVCLRVFLFVRSIVICLFI